MRKVIGAGQARAVGEKDSEAAAAQWGACVKIAMGSMVGEKVGRVHQLAQGTRHSAASTGVGQQGARVVERRRWQPK